MATTASSPINAIAASSISGNLHGGVQPVVGATVSLYAAGSTGYGSTPQLLQTTTSDSNGSFTLTNYTCPASSSTAYSQSIYLVASGGQPTTGVTNPAAAFLLALGDCATVKAANPTVNMNEVTTIASMFALQQFFKPGGASGLGTVGTSESNIAGLANAMAEVPNLVSLNGGSALASSTRTGSATITITPEQAKINTLANVLASCVNTNGSTSSGSNCATLFSDVSSSTVVDTVEAAYYLATNPTSTVNGTSNVGAIYNLSAAQTQFSPALSTAPADWTIGVTYSSSAFSNPGYLGLDSKSNLWVLSTGPTTGVTQLAPNGTPVVQALTGATLNGPRNLVIDPSDQVWVENYGTLGALGNSVVEYTSTGTTSTYITKGGPVALASDGGGNIYVATTSTTNGGQDLEVIPSGSTSGSTANTLVSSGVFANTNSTLALDAHGTLWLSVNANTATAQFLCTFNAAGTLPTSCSQTNTTAGGQTNPTAIAVDHSNNIWIGNSSPTAGTFSELNATTTNTISGASGSPFSGGGLNAVFNAQIDGSGNVWATNNSGTSSSVSELTTSGVAVSPSAGFSHTFNGAAGIGIDASGNVWIGNLTGNFITEIIGQASPLSTPLASELPVNHIGSRP
jgi:hypothetical protein